MNPPSPPRLLLLVPARTYRAADFLLAADRLGLDLVVGSDGALPLAGRPVVHVSPGDPEGSTDQITARIGRVAAVVAADTPMLALAAAVAARMGLPHNPVESVIAAADKTGQRRRWAAADVAQPAFRVVPPEASEGSLRRAAAQVGFPCVVKAVSLSASQGVLRADHTTAAAAAARRIRGVLAAARRPEDKPLLVEEYLPGWELSIDGLLSAGRLAVAAIFDSRIPLRARPSRRPCWSRPPGCPGQYSPRPSPPMGRCSSLSSWPSMARSVASLGNMIYAYPTFHRAIEAALADLAGG